MLEPGVNLKDQAAKEAFSNFTWKWWVVMKLSQLLCVVFHFVDAGQPNER